MRVYAQTAEATGEAFDATVTREQVERAQAWYRTTFGIVRQGAEQASGAALVAGSIYTVGRLLEIAPDLFGFGR